MLLKNWKEMSHRLELCGGCWRIPSEEIPDLLVTNVILYKRLAMLLHRPVDSTGPPAQEKWLRLS
jgi:hypothetical protein